MASPLVSTPNTSPAGIIEGIKQGNALELQLVKQMRNGLDRIVERLQK